MLQNSKYYYLSRYLFLPTGTLTFFLSIILIYNFKSCANELQDFRTALQDAEENFIEGTVEASPPFLKTPYSGTFTVLHYHHTEEEIPEKNKNLFSKTKIAITNQKASAMPFLLRTKNLYIYFGLFGKDFSIEHDYDFKYKNGSITQYEKHIYNKDTICIFTEEGNLRYPDSVKTNLFFFRGSKNEWLTFLELKTQEWLERIELSIYGLVVGGFLISIGILIRVLIRIGKL